MEAFLDSAETARGQTRLTYLAWRRFQIPRDVAEDLVQAAHLTFLEVRHRYEQPEDHPKIFVGIFRNKCREHIDAQVRATRRLEALRTAAAGGGPGTRLACLEEAAEDGVLGSLIDEENNRLLLEALGELQPRAREMFRLIVEEGLSRAELLEHYGLNKNTLDSRLHSYRKELREVLSRRRRLQS